MRIYPPPHQMHCGNPSSGLPKAPDPIATKQSSMTPKCNNLFLQIIAPPSVNLPFNYNSNLENHGPHALLDDIMVPELDYALFNTKSSAPGLDGISYNMIKHLPRYAKQLLTTSFNKFMHQGNLPISWNQFSIFPICKTGKAPNNAQNYRPIALSSVPRKLFEKIISNRIQFFLERDNSWPQSQFGFRKGFPTIYNPLVLTTNILLAFTEDKVVEALFLDLHSAYDSVIPKLLLQSLSYYNIPSPICTIILKLITNRSISLHHSCNNTDNRITSIGLPQGSSLSPILYALYTGLLEKLPLNTIRVLQYADDIVLYASITKSKLQQTLESSMQSDLIKIQEWLKKRGLLFNESKTQYIIFKRGYTYPNKFIQVEKKKRIYPQQHIKCLSLRMDVHLSWKAHLEYTTAKISQAQPIFKYLAGRWWGAHPSTLLTIYKSLIQTRLDYGCMLQHNNNSLAHQRLISITYQTQKLIIGINGNPARLVLEMELGILPPQLRRKKIAVKFLLSMAGSTNNILIPKIQLLDKKVDKLPPTLRQLIPDFVRIWARISSQKALRMPTLPSYSYPWKDHFFDYNIDTSTFNKGAKFTDIQFKEYI